VTAVSDGGGGSSDDVDDDDDDDLKKMMMMCGCVAGVDKFLDEMHRYYEVVLWSPNSFAVMEQVLGDGDDEEEEEW
jgi:hypothetical protein